MHRRLDMEWLSGGVSGTGDMPARAERKGGGQCERCWLCSAHDMAVLTNATVIAEDVGMKLETAEFSCLGTAKKVSARRQAPLPTAHTPSRARLLLALAPTFGPCALP
eukprot:4163102-Pleurochrysis_carterae.AAC.1